jgi:hypothetical protein
LQLGLGAQYDLGVEELTQLGAAQQFREQTLVERECRSALLGERGVAFVHECAHVAEQQRLRERRSLRRLHLDHGDPAFADARQHILQGSQVVNVLQHLAQSLQHDRERPVLAGHAQQLRRSLPLLPQR